MIKRFSLKDNELAEDKGGDYVLFVDMLDALIVALESVEERTEELKEEIQKIKLKI